MKKVRLLGRIIWESINIVQEERDMRWRLADKVGKLGRGEYEMRGLVVK